MKTLDDWRLCREVGPGIDEIRIEYPNGALRFVVFQEAS